MFSIVRKYREVLALLFFLAAAAATFVAHAPERDLDRPGVFRTVGRFVAVVEAPLERALDAAVFGAEDLYGDYVALRSVRRDNQRLRGRVFALEDELESHRELQRENDRLREMLRYADVAPLKTVSARIIGDSLAPAALTRVIRIGAGQGEGVRRGMAVVSPRGVVGRVLQAFPRFADVQLLVDPASAVAVRVERSRARANVVGTGRDHRCKLEYALRSDDIEEGDSLVTSGTDGVFPAGLSVGKVVDVQRKTSATFLRAQVVPSIDPRSLEEVLVVLSEKGSPEDEPAARK